METNIKLKEIKINSSIKKYELKTTLLGYASKGLPGKDGINGENGVTFTPSVDNEGKLSWTNNGNLDNPETKNIKGPKGEPGAKGDTGEGVPSGGTTGQVLKKKSNTDYDTEWVNESGGGSGLPSGGIVGQLLRKNSANDGDASWSSDTFIPLSPNIIEGVVKNYNLSLVPSGQYYMTETGNVYWETQRLSGQDVLWKKGTLLFIKTFQQDVDMRDGNDPVPCNCSHIFVVNKYDYYTDFSLGDAVMYNIFGFKQISGDKVGAVVYKMATFTKGGGSGGTSDYTDLTNKPKINNVELSGNKSLSDLGITIPTKTSDLVNDSGFIDRSYHDNTKQDELISGTNIKTINNESILGSGNLAIAGGADIPIGPTPPENPKDGDFWIDTSANGETYGDTLPIGAIVEYNGTTVPQGYEKVSDGNIVESGSNDNGNWIKYNDGTMICTNRYFIQKAGNTTTQSGALYVSDEIEGKSFPATFTSRPEIFFNFENATWGGKNIISIKTIGYPTTSVAPNFQLVSTITSTNTAINFEYLAIGKWK